MDWSYLDQTQNRSSPVQFTGPTGPHGLDLQTLEEIVNSGKYRGTFRYKVQWKGYGAHEQTWEPVRNVEHAAEAIAKFHKRFPNKPKPPQLARIEIPISQFPTHLFRPMPKPDTEPTPSSMPSEALVNRLAQNGTCALRRG